MYKRFISILLALVLCFSFAVTAGASTVADTISPKDNYDDCAEGDEFIQFSDYFDSPSEVNPSGKQLDVDEDGHAEIKIEVPVTSTDQEVNKPDEPITGEGDSPTSVKPEESIEPNGLPASAYPMTAYKLLWVSGTIIEDGNPIAHKEAIVEDEYNKQDINRTTVHTTRSKFLNTEDITIAIYQAGYGNQQLNTETFFFLYDTTDNPATALTLDGYGGATSFRFEKVLYKIDPALTDITFEFIGKTYDGSKQWSRTLTILFDGDRSAEPTTPEFHFDPDNPEQYILDGVDDTMEYRPCTNRVWRPCTNDIMRFSVKDSDYKYYVRYRATDGKLESKYKEVVLPGRPAAPTVSINWVDESFKNLTPDMMYTFGEDGPKYASQLMAEGSLKSLLDGISGPEYVPLCIWYPATSEQPASAVQTIKLYPRADKPDKTKLSVDPNTYILTGVTSSMQYMGPGDTAWKAISGTSVNLSNYAKSDDTVIIWVRTKSSTGKSYSTPVSVELPPAAPSPELDIDYYNEKITGFQSGVTYQYKIGSGSWTSLTPKNNEFSIASLITSKAREISIRIAGKADSKLSGSWTEQLPARIAAPACAFVYNDPANVGSAVLTGLDAEMEYQLKGETTWTRSSGQDIVMSLPSTSKTYYVRVAATDSSFASTKKTLTLYAPGTAPTSSLNITTEKITISKTAEYRIDNGAYITLPSGITTLSATEYIDQLSGSEIRTITVRFAATETKPASKEKTIKLVARREGPTTMQFDAATQKITGATTSMQYRVKGTTAWKTVTSKTFSVASLLEGQTNVVLEFRYKPANSLVGSKITELNCF